MIVRFCPIPSCFVSRGAGPEDQKDIFSQGFGFGERETSMEEVGQRSWVDSRSSPVGKGRRCKFWIGNRPLRILSVDSAAMVVPWLCGASW